jgi:hypothetical protein
VAVLALLLLGAGSRWARGQTAPLSEQSRVSLITILPGDPVYSFAGHSAVRVRDPARELDRLYNYGTFSFNDPLFIPKFTYGHLRYFLSVAPYAPMLRVYERQGRPVIEQHLNLTRTQRTALFRFLQNNARPEHRYYQYDFFFDNCSTRIRDALKATLGGRVDFSAAPPPHRSFRRLLDPYVASRPLLDLGFDLALGLPADREATAWEAMFLPEHLKRGFDHATVTTEGTTRPLVARTDTVRWVSDYSATESVFDWPFALSGLFFVLVLGWTSWQATTERTPGGRGDAVLLAVVGAVGLLMCYLWFISTYAVTNYNLNLGWAWPTHLLAAAVLLRRPRTRGLRLYLAGTAVAAVVFVLGWSLWPQNLHVAVLPLVLSVGVRAGWRALVLSQRDTLLFSSRPSLSPGGSAPGAD